MTSSLREKLNRVIFGTDSRSGKLFDVVLLWLIVASVLVVMLESLPALNAQYFDVFLRIELVFTILFTIEYILRVFVAHRPLKYVSSYWGIIDLLGVLPFYLSILATDYHYFVVFRLLRLLRVFRILRLLRFIHESELLFRAMRASLYKIIIFISFVLTIVILLGTMMYVVEGPEHGFTSIPQSIYWTIVTITTVGYGDITPQTAPGKWIASVVMLCGYAIIAVPTGIVTVEMSRQGLGLNPCSKCRQSNPSDAIYCNKCGTKMGEVSEENAASKKG